MIVTILSMMVFMVPIVRIRIRGGNVADDNVDVADDKD